MASPFGFKCFEKECSRNVCVCVATRFVRFRCDDRVAREVGNGQPMPPSCGGLRVQIALGMMAEFDAPWRALHNNVSDLLTRQPSCLRQAMDIDVGRDWIDCPLLCQRALEFCMQRRDCHLPPSKRSDEARINVIV